MKTSKHLFFYLKARLDKEFTVLPCKHIGLDMYNTIEAALK